MLFARGSLLAVVVAVVGVSATLGLLSYPDVVPSFAVQNPSLSIDMVTTGNIYCGSDGLDQSGNPCSPSNSMTVGSIDDCLTSPTGNPATHIHVAHLIVQNVEDLVGWQARLNYIGDKMRPSGFNGAPFTDGGTGGVVGFATLPLDEALVHRDFVPTSSIPAAPPDGSNTSQTALVGGVYNGSQSFAVSPDQPHKATPDDSSYDTFGGGVAGTLTLQILGNETGQASLFMNVDDGNPNPPESNFQVFNGSGLTALPIPVNQLGDGYHGEGATCAPLNCVDNYCPPLPPDITNHTFTNNTPLPASRLHVRFSKAVTPVLVQNAPGCPSPTMSGDHAAGRVDLEWAGTIPCVDSGETVVIEITSEQPRAGAICHHWASLGQTLFGNCGP